jgi:hypothetical protein
MSQPRSGRDAGSPTTGAWRALRGFVVGSTAMGIAAAGHVLGGGRLPGVTSLAALALVVSLACVWLSDLRWTTSRLVLALALAQIAFHGLLIALTASSPAGHDTMSAMRMHGAALGMTYPMLFGHLAAVLTSAVLLGRGERWLWAIAKLLGLWLPRVPLRLRQAPALAYARLVDDDDLVSPRGLVLAKAHARRGPPVVLTA